MQGQLLRSILTFRLQNVPVTRYHQDRNKIEDSQGQELCLLRVFLQKRLPEHNVNLFKRKTPKIFGG